MPFKISAILLCGGTGSRFGGPIPKQYLPLGNKPVAHHSLDVLISSKQIAEVVIVCSDKDLQEFATYALHEKIGFAQGGATRQESVQSGLSHISSDTDFICIHDGARPFLSETLLHNVLEEALLHGAAALGVQAKNTIKVVNNQGFVEKTLLRHQLFEMQTPQVLSKELLQKGMALAKAKKIEATDDVSLAELSGASVKITASSYQNIKITTEEDMILAQALWRRMHGEI